VLVIRFGMRGSWVGQVPDLPSAGVREVESGGVKRLAIFYDEQ
jgi:hypothetical protein